MQWMERKRFRKMRKRIKDIENERKKETVIYREIYIYIYVERIGEIFKDYLIGWHIKYMQRIKKKKCRV